jgi:hypothetical protein
MAPQTNADALRIPDDVISEIVDGEAVLLNLKTGVYYSLNHVGTRIWQLIEQLGDERRVRDAGLGEYAVDAAQLDLDFARLLADLLERGLVARGR